MDTRLHYKLFSLDVSLKTDDVARCRPVLGRYALCMELSVCKVAKTPRKYLGLPLHNKPRRPAARIRQ